MEASLLSSRELHDIASAVVALARGHNGTVSSMDLSDLRASLKLLRRSYGADQSKSGYVKVSYIDDVAIAYLAAYLPQYVSLAELNLERCLRTMPEVVGSCDRPLSIALLGPGPCPELIALAHLLDQRHPTGSAMIAHLFDRNHDGWAVSRRAVTEIIHERFPHLDIDLRLIDQDLTAECRNTPDPINPKLDLVLGQNLLNETTTSLETFLKNLLTIANQLREGCSLMLVDQRSRATEAGMECLRRSASPEWRSTSFTKQLTIDAPSQIDHPHLWTLFDRNADGLIPRTRVKFHAIELTRE